MTKTANEIQAVLIEGYSLEDIYDHWIQFV